MSGQGLAGLTKLPHLEGCPSARNGNGGDGGDGGDGDLDSRHRKNHSTPLDGSAVPNLHWTAAHVQSCDYPMIYVELCNGASRRINPCPFGSHFETIKKRSSRTRGLDD